MGWSPLDAMNAYMHTLQLCKDYYNKECNNSTEGSKLMEPKSMELISALAAGNQARLMVDVTSNVTSPLTLALAVAARLTGGRLICIRDDPHALEETKKQLEYFNLGDVAELKLGSPVEVIKQCSNIDFAVMDGEVENPSELFFALEMNPRGSVVVVSDLLLKNGRKSEASYAQVAKGKGRVESMVLPIGEGIEVTRIIGRKGGRDKDNRGRRPKRTWIVFEE